MKIDKKLLIVLNKQWSELKKDEKVISLNEVRKELNEVIDKIEKLEDMLSEQMNMIEVFDECDDGSCTCEELEQSELWEVFSELEDRVISGEFHRALRILENVG